MANSRRIKQKEIRPLREKILKEQKFICPVCTTEIKEGEDVLDHSHKTGHIRAVLHRSCNMAMGRIMNWARRTKDSEPLHFLEGMLKFYDKDYTDNDIHPKHLTANEKELKKLRKHQKTLKSQKGRRDVQARIDEMIRRIDEENSEGEV